MAGSDPQQVLGAQQGPLVVTGQQRSLLGVETFY